MPQTFWRSLKNRRRYLAWLGKELGFRRWEDWYGVTTLDFQKRRGGALLLRYRSSVAATVMACFPEHDWKEWKFRKIPMRFWRDPRNCRRYLDWLGQRLGYKHLDDWYGVKARDFVRNYGRELLKGYRGSPAAVVVETIPRRQWHEWRFTRVPPGFWHRAENRLRYVQWLGKRLGFRQAEDWRRLHHKDFRRNYGGTLMCVYRSRWDLLEECLPELDGQSCRRQPLSIEQILGWADAWFARHGKWPRRDSGPIPETPETWASVAASLGAGHRGLSGGVSLPRLLEEHRGVPVGNRPHSPPLTPDSKGRDSS
ncbi:MAG: hypothetical protein ACYC35_21330 [Pirellulales bacterium]